MSVLTDVCVRFFTYAIAVVAFSLPAYATVIGGSVTGGTAHAAGGTFVKVSPPLSNPHGASNSVGNDTFQLPNLFAFDEDQNILLEGDLSADVGLKLIPMGTKVASHYVFFDPQTETTLVGTVDFDANIVAVITSESLLISSDFLARSGVNYLSPSLRGLEPEDSVTITGLKQIAFDSYASTPGDYIRVLTEYSPAADSPEPGTGLVAGAAIALFCLIRRGR